MKKLLIVIDMQNDFIHGSLGSEEARAIVPAVVDKVKAFEGTVLFTMDTHDAGYPKTQEGEKLPVPHCQKGTDGWELVQPLKEWCEKNQGQVFLKNTFGSKELAKALEKIQEQEGISSIELAGVCTDICVISNALLIKAFLPETPIMVDRQLVAGVSKDRHTIALEAMKCCQINVQ